MLHVINLIAFVLHAVLGFCFFFRLVPGMEPIGLKILNQVQLLSYLYLATTKNRGVVSFRNLPYFQLQRGLEDMRSESEFLWVIFLVYKPIFHVFIPEPHRRRFIFNLTWIPCAKGCSLTSARCFCPHRFDEDVS
jgi:hypothetical protein